MSSGFSGKDPRGLCPTPGDPEREDLHGKRKRSFNKSQLLPPTIKLHYFGEAGSVSSRIAVHNDYPHEGLAGFVLFVAVLMF
jgi:hypothetical protein